MVKIMCLIILALEARGLFISISEEHWKIFAFYTVEEIGDAVKFYENL